VDTLPDILVLGGGGRQGDAWLTGVLAGIEDSSGLSFARCEYLVGTSAGAIVAARLACCRTGSRFRQQRSLHRSHTSGSESQRCQARC
jgi:predicted acylesterase/phospholipase RssA